MTAEPATAEELTDDGTATPAPLRPHDAARSATGTAAAQHQLGKEIPDADEQDPEDDLLGRILSHDPAPPLTDEQREEMRRGWSELIAEHEAEFGPFTKEERAWARARLSSEPG